MPRYDFKCKRCESIMEKVFGMNDEKIVMCCGEQAERIYTPPRLSIWNPDWDFPNLSPKGDGTKKFASKVDYETFLKENNFAELSTAPKKEPRRLKIMSDGKA